MVSYARVLWGLVLLWVWTANGIAAPCVLWVTRVVSIEGTIEVKRLKQGGWSRIQLHDQFCAGDSIRADVNSRAGLLLRNETLLRLDQGTTLVLPQLHEEDSAWLELVRGAVHFISNVPYRLKIKTPFVNAAIEGTEFAVRVSEVDTKVWVLEGKVLVDNPQGSISLGPGDAAVAEAGKPPVPYLKITPRDAVQWALYYPPIIDYRPSMEVDPQRQRAITLYRTGQIPASIEALNSVPDTARDSSFFTQRAALLLTVGQVQSAQKDIDKALALSPNSGGPRALQSVIALTQNDKVKALSLAQEAVKLEPKSPTPQVALSYAQQAAFDIEGARESIKKALELAPDDPLAWARLSELELSTGELDNALDAAKKAEALDPNLSRTQMVLGFAQLMEIDIDEAKESFTKAIALDPSAPLPRLGMGLAKIRQGDVEEGRKDIEVAAILDPENSLIRSYLGKAYYEEKRGNVASREFAMAKQLDPKDPTPWFYDAIHKQTTNRPVEALHDMQRAIELNDNRAVYRSSLLLDDDLAARSASLGRIYNDLSFQQLGLLQGWKSVNTDSSNYSAHRLLADTYNLLPGHEIARVSELLQSQLLQPINLTPVQPQLAESNLLIFGGLGPADQSFNEFNPLFSRNRLALQASAIYGSNQTVGDEIVQSGVWNNFSYSLGQFHYETDGFRQNNDLKEDIYTGFFQVAISPKLSFQAEARYRESESGDLRLNFDKLFSPNERLNIRTHSLRVGVHFSPSPKTDVIVSGIYDNVNREINDSFEFVQGCDKGIDLTDCVNILGISLPPGTLLPPIPIADAVVLTDRLDTSIERDNKSYSGEIQVNHRFELVNLITGGGYFYSDTLRQSFDTRIFTLNSQVCPTALPNSLQTGLPTFLVTAFNGLIQQNLQCQFGAQNPIIGTDFDNSYGNAYLYTNVKLLDTLKATLGISFDSLDSRFVDINKINPKLGLIWQTLPSTTVRAAWLKTLKRPFISNQTIEPTQVAGFNQFFDDTTGSRTTRYGIALDHRFSSDFFAGIEATWRELARPLFFNPQGNVTNADDKEQLHRGYIFWIPYDWLALSAQYFYEQLKTEFHTTQFRNRSKLTIHRLPLDLKFFIGASLFMDLTGTYVHEDKNELIEEFAGRVVPGSFGLSSEFWLFDATVGYRLPNRLGLVRFGVKNILDRKFRFEPRAFQTANPITIPFQPERTVFGQITLAF